MPIFRRSRIVVVSHYCDIDLRPREVARLSINQKVMCCDRFCGTGQAICCGDCLDNITSFDQEDETER